MNAIARPDLARSLVAAQFGVEGTDLRIGGLGASELLARFGSPLYVYDAGLLRRNYRALAEAVKGFAEVYFSIKANPNPGVAAVLVAEGAGLEIASGSEYVLARQAGCRPERLLFAGPGKSIAELDLVIENGIAEIHLESFEEITDVAALARAKGRRVPVAIRVNPGEAAQGGAMRMGGKPTAFGFDEETLDDVVAAVLAHPELHLSGLHLFAGTQVLDAAVLIAQWRYGLALGARLAARLGRPLERLDLGGGLGIPYHAGDPSLDLAALADGAKILAAEAAREPGLRGTAILIEPGRFLAGPAGVYLARVRAAKTSRGQRFLVTDGGMHHHLAASGNLGQVIKRDYPIVAATRMNEPATGTASVVGPLCTPLDTIGRQVALPDLVAGDAVAVLQSGAYGLSSSPVGFLGHPMPAEILVEDGRARVIRPAGSFAAPLVNPSPVLSVPQGRLEAARPA